MYFNRTYEVVILGSDRDSNNAPFASHINTLLIQSHETFDTSGWFCAIRPNCVLVVHGDRLLLLLRLWQASSILSTSVQGLETDILWTTRQVSRRSQH